MRGEMHIPYKEVIADGTEGSGCLELDGDVGSAKRATRSPDSGSLSE